MGKIATRWWHKLARIATIMSLIWALFLFGCLAMTYLDVGSPAPLFYQFAESSRGDSYRGGCASVAQSSFTGHISKVFNPSLENRFPAVPLRDVAINDSNGFYYRNTIAPVNNLVNTDEHSVFKRQSTQRSIALCHPVNNIMLFARR